MADLPRYEVLYDYSDVPTIKKFAMDDSRVRCLLGCFGSGKSSGCVLEIIRRANAQKQGPDGIRRSRWAVIRNTYSQLRDTTIKTFHDWFPPKIFGEWRVTDHVYIMTKFPGVHLEVLFRALDRPDQVSNLLSLELTGAWFNEVREIPFTLIDAMDSRIGRYPSKRDGGASWYGMIFDSNPPDEDSELYNRFEKIRPDNWKLFKQPSGLSTHAENTKHLPARYYQNLAKGKSEMYKRIYIHGQYGYIVSGKPVFTSFVDNVHVAPNILEPIKGIDIIMGFDFGLQPACCIAQLTPLGQLRILDELVSDGMGIRQFCENQLLPLLRKKYFGMNVMGYGDPSGTSRAPTDESTCFDILHSKDIGLTNIIPAETNAILPRVSAVETFLNKMYKGEPGFMLSPNCHFLRKAMNGGYHYEKEPKSLGQEYKPMPAKNFSSHVCLSGDTMVLMENGEKRIDKIVAGDRVITPYGIRKVTASSLTRRDASVVEIEMSDGVKIKCTENHKFILANKYIAKCNALRYTDVLQKYESWRTLKWSIQSLLSFKVRSIGFRQAITTGQRTGGKVFATFTGRFGSFITNVKSLMATTFTTLTTIGSTTIFPTLNLSTGQTMPDTILKRDLMPEPLIMKSLFYLPEKRQNRGIRLLKAGHGMEFTEKRHGKTEGYLPLPAKIVGLRSRHHFLPERLSVVQTVGIRQDTIAESTTFKERVLFVVKTLRRIGFGKLKPAPRIVRISPCSKTENVYNITVDTDHVFYANGVLTCNCDSLEMLCLYLEDKGARDKRHRSFLAQIKRHEYRPASSEAGY